MCEENLEVGSDVGLTQEESHHLGHVLRLQISDRVHLVNGKGTLAWGVVKRIAKGKALITIEEKKSFSQKNRIWLVFGIPKSSALDFIIRRCTEVGVAGFQPLLTSRSLRGSMHLERWKRVITEVCKQSEELFFPVLHSPLILENWLETREKSRTLIFCSEHARLEPLNTVPSDIDLVIGPEGGWGPEEITRLNSIGFPFGLGENRLRTETAALIATALLNSWTKGIRYI